MRAVIFKRALDMKPVGFVLVEDDANLFYIMISITSPLSI